MTAVATTRTVTLTRTDALVAAGPLWAAVSIAQAATRDGFHITQHPLSLLSTGSLGWIQIANFVVAGVLTLVGAAVLPSIWARRLVRVGGAGLIAAGVLVMDPIMTPGAPMSWHSLGHMAAGSITFTALIAACYVLARRFFATGDRAWAIGGLVSGTALLAGDLWCSTGGAVGSLTLAVGAITAMCFVSLVATRRW